jgi:hypothetical protein
LRVLLRPVQQLEAEIPGRWAIEVDHPRQRRVDARGQLDLGDPRQAMLLAVAVPLVVVIVCAVVVVSAAAMLCAPVIACIVVMACPVAVVSTTGTMVAPLAPLSTVLRSDVDDVDLLRRPDPAGRREDPYHPRHDDPATQPPAARPVAHPRSLPAPRRSAWLRPPSVDSGPVRR